MKLRIKKILFTMFIFVIVMSVIGCGVEKEVNKEPEIKDDEVIKEDVIDENSKSDKLKEVEKEKENVGKDSITNEADNKSNENTASTTPTTPTYTDDYNKTIEENENNRNEADENISNAEKNTKDESEEKEGNNSNLVSLGEFKLTAYCNCSTCCGQWAGGATASGVMPQANHTIAVDTSVIPFGTQVVINGNTYVAEDTGSGVGGNSIDIYFDSHSAALNFGVQYAEVFKVVD